MRAEEGSRTPDLLITNQLLYQLSYASTKLLISKTQTAYREKQRMVSAAAAEELRVIAEEPNGAQVVVISMRCRRYGGNDQRVCRTTS